MLIKVTHLISESGFACFCDATEEVNGFV